MGALVVILLLLALLLGGFGLFIEGLKWLIIIALIVLAVGILMGFMGRGRHRSV